MKVLDFEVSLDEIKNGKLELADLIKTSLWQHSPKWLDNLDFEDDNIFLEPLLFYYFRKLGRNDETVITLDQILFGYAQKGSANPIFEVFSDPDGIIYLPNLGYIRTNKSGISKQNITLINENRSASLSGKEFQIQPLKKIKNAEFLLLQSKPYIYKEIGGLSVEFLERIEDSINYSKEKIEAVLNKMEDGIPTFFDAVRMTTREFAIFNSNNFESFAALHHFGTAFLNLADQKQKPVFFLDDIAHQSGHIVYYALTHNFQKFLKPHRDAQLKDFTKATYETRNVYGAFHGLFTYTTILHCLHVAYQQKWFKGLEEEENLSRIGFYFQKFENDLKSMGDSRILTEEGWRYYDMFQSGFVKIKREYYHLIKDFDYKDQNYNYSFQKFQDVNNFQTV